MHYIAKHNLLVKVNSKNKAWKLAFLFTLFLSLIFSGGAFSNLTLFSCQKAKAQTENESFSLQVFYTANLHGQLTNFDYETGKAYTKGSLSQISTLLKEQKAKITTGSAMMLLDGGDFFGSYTTNYAYQRNQKSKQPILSGMSVMEYDAISPSYHDFDYGTEYLENQLKMTGLYNSTVLSNAKKKRSDTDLFGSKIVTKKIIGKTGQNITVKVGIIGEVSSGEEGKKSLSNELEIEAMLENAKEEAKELKQAGADLVFVMANTTVGKESGSSQENELGYQLTSIEDVDAVFCSMGHEQFPDVEQSSMAGYDSQTGLVNGKPLIQVKQKGAQYAQAIFELVTDQTGQLTVKALQTTINKVPSKTQTDKTVDAGIGNWKSIFDAESGEILCELEQGTKYNNYFGVVCDNDLMQLKNQMKMEYAIRYINTQKTSLKSYPVIGASTYQQFGHLDDGDYTNLEKEITTSDLYHFMRYDKELYIYQITGKNLREWIEWTAGCYASYEENPDVLLKPSVSYQWSDFYGFDGIEYTINPDREARYDEKGNRISSSNRVVSLTINNVNITDTDQFLVVTEKLPENTFFTNLNKKEITKISAASYRESVKKMLKQYSQAGGLDSLCDNNWNLEFDHQRQISFVSGTDKSLDVSAYPFLINQELQENGYTQNKIDTAKLSSFAPSSPNLTVVLKDEEPTNKNVTVLVTASAKNGIKSIRYTKGKYGVSNKIWEYADKISGQTASLPENGVYSFYVQDKKGNATTKYLRISTIDKSMLDAPVLNPVSNCSTKVTGKAVAKTRVYLLVNGKTYSAQVSAKGTFSCTIPVQSAGRKIAAYIINSKAQTSFCTTISVKRIGPNKPTIKKIDFASQKVILNMHDLNVYPLVIVNKKIIYVPNENAKKKYMASSGYNKTYTIRIGSFAREQDGSISLRLPSSIVSNTTIHVRSLDGLKRSSLTTGKLIKQGVPLVPKFGLLYNQSNFVNVYTSEKNTTSAKVSILSKEYSSSTKKYDSKSKKYYFTVKIPKTKSTTLVTAWVSNKKGKSQAIRIYPKKSVPENVTCTNIAPGVKRIEGTVDLVGGKKKVPTVKSTKTKVTVTVGKSAWAAKVKNDGTFWVVIPKPLKVGQIVKCQAFNRNGASKVYKIKVSKPSDSEPDIRVPTATK